MSNCDVFISYSSLDRAQADEVRAVLAQNGISCWMAPYSIPAGSDYAKAIPAAIDGCKAFVILLSDNSQQSKYVQLELGQAFQNEKPIIPFAIENCPLTDDFDFILSRSQRINAFYDKSSALMELVAAIRRILAPAPAGSVNRAVPIAIAVCVAVLAVAAAIIVIILIGGKKEAPSPEPSPAPSAVETLPQTEAPTEAPTELPTEPPTLPAVIDDYVEVGREETYLSENNNITYRIPRFLMDSIDAQAANDEIEDVYGPQFLHAAEIEQKGAYSGIYGTDYQAALISDVVSVIITTRYDANYFENRTYNFDASTGSLLNNRALIRKLGLDYDEIEDIYTEALINDYTERFPDTWSKDTTLYNSTLSKNTLDNVKLYITEDGQLSAAAEEQTAAGSGICFVWINFYQL